MLVQPYLFFDGNCEEAIGFYRDALGGELEALMRYHENPETPPPECAPPAGWEDKVMHACLRIGELRLMASDDASRQSTRFEGFSLALTVPDEAAADRAFAALVEGGQVLMPLDRTFWSPRFGMLVDRFGVGWMVMALETPCPETAA